MTRCPWATQTSGALLHDSVTISSRVRRSTWCNVLDVSDKEYVLLGRCVLVSTSLHSALLLYPSVSVEGVEEGVLNDKELKVGDR